LANKYHFEHVSGAYLQVRSGLFTKTCIAGCPEVSALCQGVRSIMMIGGVSQQRLFARAFLLLSAIRGRANLLTIAGR
jgi:hypothetical protein